MTVAELRERLTRYKDTDEVHVHLILSDGSESYRLVVTDTQLADAGVRLRLDREVLRAEFTARVVRDAKL